MLNGYYYFLFTIVLSSLSKLVKCNRRAGRSNRVKMKAYRIKNCIYILEPLHNMAKASNVDK